VFPDGVSAGKLEKKLHLSEEFVTKQHEYKETCYPQNQNAGEQSHQPERTLYLGGGIVA
jgi:hypothetical protein